MQLPGDRLLALSRVVFNDDVRINIANQTIADMRAEWIAAGSGSGARLLARWRGYFAFWSLVAIAPFALRTKPSWRFEMKRVTQIRMTIVLLLLGIIGGYIVSRAMPVRYRSTAVVQLVPPRISAAVATDVDISDLGSLEDRMWAAKQVALSRTRLERMIREFNLFETDKNAITEETIESMRRNISVDITPRPRAQIRVEYVGSQPVTVMKVTEKIAAYFIEESLKEAQRRAEGTASFVEAETEQIKARLIALTAQEERSGARRADAQSRGLEIEAVQTLYKNLLIRQAQATMRVDLERRQIGEQFTLLEAARAATKPLGPTSLQLTMAGGAFGLALSALIMLGAWLRRLLTSARRPAPASA